MKIELVGGRSDGAVHEISGTIPPDYWWESEPYSPVTIWSDESVLPVLSATDFNNILYKRTDRPSKRGHVIYQYVKETRPDG